MWFKNFIVSQSTALLPPSFHPGPQDKYNNNKILDSLSVCCRPRYFKAKFAGVSPKMYKYQLLLPKFAKDHLTVVSINSIILFTLCITLY